MKRVSLSSLRKSPSGSEPPARSVAKSAEPDLLGHEVGFGPARKQRKMSLYVAPEVWKELQLRKIDEGRDVNTIINEAIRAYLMSQSGV